MHPHPLIFSDPSIAPTRAFLQFTSERSLLLESLTRLTALAAHSPNLFASPLGPLSYRNELFMLPRHLFFGENSAEEAWRVALYAGFSGLDTRAGLASVRTLERLALEPQLAHSFNLAFHSFLNPSGLTDGTQATRRGDQLLEQSWADPKAPELQLLERDTRAMQYHGAIIIRSDSKAEELRGWLRGFSPSDPFLHAQPVRGTSRTGYLPFKFPVQWELHPEGQTAQSGPLTLADDLRVRPFELTLLVPSKPSLEWAVQAVSSTVRVFLNNFRTAVSTGWNL